MLADELIIRLRQIKMDALSAKYLHEKRLRPTRFLSTLVDVLALGVPLAYVPLRMLARGTSWEGLVETIWELLLAALGVMALVKLGFQWQDGPAKHGRQRSANLLIVNEVDALIARATTATAKDAEWLMKLAVRENDIDGELFGAVSDKEKQEAHRAALKEIDPSNAKTVCTNCGSSPWNYHPGTCQMCGGTPKAP